MKYLLVLKSIQWRERERERERERKRNQSLNYLTFDCSVHSNKKQFVYEKSHN